MARIRSIKPEVRKSRTVTSWPYVVRLAWVYLWGYLDDEGRGEDDLSLIKAECFPRDSDVTERKLDGWLWRMTEKVAGDDEPSLCRYMVDGVPLLHAPKWLQHQRINRPTPSRFAHCPLHEDGMSGHVRFSEDSVRAHGGLSE